MEVSMKKDYENKIQELRKKMTLEEKIGQLQQCGPSLVGPLRSVSKNFWI